MKTTSVVSWLNHLQLLRPPRSVMLVGAGNGNGPFVQWLKQASVEAVTLVEAEDTHLPALQRLVEHIPSWRVRHELVAPQRGPADFHVASVGSESGLLRPEVLRGLWPNIKTRQVQNRQAISIRELLDEGGSVDWLVIDCLPGAALIEAAADALTSVDVIFARGLLGSAGEMHQEGSINKAVQALTALGFSLACTETSRHPDVGHGLLVRDQTAELHALRIQAAQAAESQQETQAQLLQAQADFTRLEARLAELQTSKNNLHESHAALVAELTAVKSAAADLAATRQKELELAKHELASARVTFERAAADRKNEEALLNGLASSLQEANARLDNTREEVTATRTQNSSEHGEIKKLLNESKDALRQEVGKEIVNATKQLEAFISVQNYLSTGESISNFHGWPISPDIALFLVERLNEKQHDLVIEFGSGTSTTLFGKALMVGERLGRHARRNNICRRVMAIEHDPKYARQTASAVAAHGVTQWVELLLAPLQAWTEDEAEYLHYDCEQAFADINAAAAGEQLSILVLVDGPPGVTCKNARYPAVPKLFKHLCDHQIDLVLDDAGRPEELAVIELWRQFWKKNDTYIEESFLSSEKGLYFARNYKDDRTETAR